MGFTWCARVRTGTAESAHTRGRDRSRCRENMREHDIEEETVRRPGEMYLKRGYVYRDLGITSHGYMGDAGMGSQG